MRNLLYAFLLIVTGLFVTSCNNDEDTDAPTIQIIRPEENTVVNIGSALNMRFRFTDEYGVGYYSYEIFHQDGVVPGEFYYKKEIDISGIVNEFEINHSVNIPKFNADAIPTATGDYILRVVAIDWHNNRNFVDLPIKIEEELTEE